MNQKHHQNECKCAACEGSIEQTLADQKRMIEQHGWVAHYLTELDPSSPTGCNAHTHGVSDNLQHLDFQCVIPLPPEMMHSIFTTLVDRVKSGEKFEAGSRYSKIIRNFDVTFIEAVEGGRTVLRIIFPSPNGSLDPLTMDKDAASRSFREQFGVTDHTIEGGFNLTKGDSHA